MSEKKNILISVSGGRTSAFMAVYLKELYHKENLLFLYANTGKERPETLEFLNKLDNHFNIGIVWLEAKVNPLKGKGTTYKIVDYNTCSKNGEPFADVIDKYGLPSKLYRHCTRELKEAPIHKYAKEILGKNYLTAIGIRADEKHRLTQKKNYIYPLAEMNIDKIFINSWWKRQIFDLELKEHEGNCDFCFLKSKRKRVLLLSEGLNVDWWNEIEKKYSTDRQPMMDVRNNATIEDLITINNDMNKQLTLLDDIGFDCFCKAS
jgi:hypothetical protein